MTYIKMLRIGLLGASCLALGACFGSSTGGGAGGGAGGGGAGGGGGPLTAAEYDARFNALSSASSGLAPTSTELRGLATFSGATQIDLFSAADPTITGQAIGELAVQADFDGETIAGQATNFQGTLDGQAVALTGTLDSANGIAPSVLSEVTSPIILPPGLPPIPGAPTSVTSNTFTLNMGGQLSDSTGVIGDVNLGIGGAFLGPIGGTTATAAVGAATVVVSNVPGTPGLIDIGGAGTFYIERD